MSDVIINIFALLIIAGAISAIFHTYKWWNWQDKLGGKALRFLYYSAVTVAVVSVPLAIIATYRLTQGREAPPFPFGGEILAISLAVLILNLSVTTFSFRELDQAVKTGKTIQEYDETERGVED